MNPLNVSIELSLIGKWEALKKDLDGVSLNVLQIMGQICSMKHQMSTWVW